MYALDIQSIYKIEINGFVACAPSNDNGRCETRPKQYDLTEILIPFPNMSACYRESIKVNL